MYLASLGLGLLDRRITRRFPLFRRSLPPIPTIFSYFLPRFISISMLSRPCVLLFPFLLAQTKDPVWIIAYAGDSPAIGRLPETKCYAK